MPALLVLALLALAGLCRADEVVEIRVHGNATVPDDEIIRLAGVEVGDQLSEPYLDEVRRRLRGSGRFEWVRLLVRYRSLERAERAVLIIVVRERPPLAKKFMFMPILEVGGQYGFTYGIRVVGIDLLGTGERLSFPLTWGGTKRAAVEASRDFGVVGPLRWRLFAGAGILSRENPFYEVGDDRVEVWGGAAARFDWLLLRFRGGWTDIEFGALDESFFTYGVDVALDTRRDVSLPRDAVYAGFGWERLAVRDGGPACNLYSVDLRGYKGLIGQSILAGRFYHRRADAALPPYQKLLLGGASALRGHRSGDYVGDNIALASLELRLPLTPLAAFYRAGFHFFFDAGAVYDHGTAMGDADFHYGAGIGAWAFAGFFGLKAEIAHDLVRSLRFHLSTGFRF